MAEVTKEPASTSKARRPSFAGSGSGGSSAGATAIPTILKRMGTGESDTGPLLMIKVNEVGSPKDKQREKERNRHGEHRPAKSREHGSDKESKVENVEERPKASRHSSSRSDRKYHSESRSSPKSPKLGFFGKAITTLAEHTSVRPIWRQEGVGA
jgi:hypothetical protein